MSHTFDPSGVIASRVYDSDVTPGSVNAVIACPSPSRTGSR
jgi:hypothetical protein